MPLDILLSYLYFDSIAKTFERESADSIVNTMCYSDTLRNAMKYLYKLDDYDPLAYFQFCFSPPVRYPQKSFPATLSQSIIRRAVSLFPENGLLPGFCYNDLILHIHINDTMVVTDSSLASDINKSVIISATVLDTIKGKRLPSCAMNRRFSIYSSKNEIKPQSEENCFQFEYSLFWQSRISNSRFHYNAQTKRDNSGSLWTQKGIDYIVFLRLQNLGLDSVNSYFTCYPSSSEGLSGSTCMGIYLIEDGKVVDEKNDFGFGINLTVSDFKSRLRQKIDSLLMN